MCVCVCVCVAFITFSPTKLMITSLFLLSTIVAECKVGHISYLGCVGTTKFKNNLADLFRIEKSKTRGQTA